MHQMFFVVWQDEFATGIPIVDEQLRGLVSLINTFFFHRADAKGDISRFLVPTAEMFKSYAQLNFLTMERLLREAGYPELDEYRKKHRDVICRIRVMDARYRRERNADGFLDLLKNYWVKSIQSEKKPYMTWLLAHHKISL